MQAREEAKELSMNDVGFHMGTVISRGGEGGSSSVVLN